MTIKRAAYALPKRQVKRAIRIKRQAELQGFTVTATHNNSTILLEVK